MSTDTVVTPSQQPGPLTLALIGAGKSGRFLAAAALRAGHRVVLEDVMPARLREALDELPGGEDVPGELETVLTVEDAVREADLAIDFVPDELESKLEIACMVDRMAPPRTVLCINTRTLGINDLSSCTYRADRCVGIDFREDQVWINPGSKTAPETLEMVRRFAGSCGFEVQLQGEVATTL